MSVANAVNDFVNVALAALMARASSCRPMVFNVWVATWVCETVVWMICEPVAMSVGSKVVAVVDSFANSGCKKS